MGNKIFKKYWPFLVFLGLTFCSSALGVQSIFAQENKPRAAEQKPFAISIQKRDSLETDADKEIKQTAQFGTKQKVTSLVVGSIFGFFVGARVGVAIGGGRGFDAYAGALYGGAAGVALGALTNYCIVYYLAKRAARKKRIKVEHPTKRLSTVP